MSTVSWRRRGFYFFSFLLLCLTPTYPRAEESLTFGSQMILEKLWTPEALQGNIEERNRRRAPLVDRLAPTLPELQAKPSFLPLAPVSSIRRVKLKPQYKVIALTFDLCEGVKEISGYDAPLVDYLRSEHVHATFFAGGKWMRNHQERALQLIADPLFEVGNHSWSHANLRLATGQRLHDQIFWPQAQYALLREEVARRARQQGIDEQEIAKIPTLPLTFRFPYGVCSAVALDAVATAALSAIQWDVVSGDPDGYQTAQQMITTVLHQAQSGSIVVFHANGRGHDTAAALPHLVAALRERGFTFVTVSELLQLALQTGGTVASTSDCYELRPGDNHRYDRVTKKEAHS